MEQPTQFDLEAQIHYAEFEIQRINRMLDGVTEPLQCIPLVRTKDNLQVQLNALKYAAGQVSSSILIH